ncbi:ABC-three component system protein [Rhodoblastus sp.]|uniref:ABC-three component system protein n=1 Tax=Rhodoblastus sp. TaxID=1962975 RepID=UPI003F958AD0
MSSGLGNYDATASATGYLYQCRLALFTGVRAIAETPNLELSIERFDDVAFEQGGEPIQLIQAKHHVSKKGTLTDASSDLWKTLRIWAERVAQDGEAPFSTSFVLMTTGAAPDGSAAGHLRARDRNEEKAHELLVTAATTSKSETNKKSYKAFLDLPQEARLSLLRAILVLDGSPNIIDVHEELSHELRHAVAKNHLPLFLERLEGWWFGTVIGALTGTGLAAIPLTAIEDKMDELRESFRRDSLPVDYADKAPPEAVIAELDKRPFVRQLRLIAVGAKRVELAIRDYYRAYEQRSRWAREDLLVDGEIESYERELVEAWEPRFEAAKDELEDGCSDAEKVQAGQKIFKWAETEADFPLRSVRQRFLTHGSFHMLANRHAVGWHPDHATHTPADANDA